MSKPAADANDNAFTFDSILDGRLRLMQPEKGHRAGTDAVLLAAAVRAVNGTLIDAGAGVGTVGLAIALRDETARVVLLERDPLYASLARRNVALNDMEGRARIIEADLLVASARRESGLANENADVVVTNPPFFTAGSGLIASSLLKRQAHVLDVTLDDWLGACCALLRPGGVVHLVHRAEALMPVLDALRTRTGNIAVRPVHPQSTSAATRILVSATKASRGPLRILPALVLHDADGRFTPEAAALHRGDVFTT